MPWHSNPSELGFFNSCTFLRASRLVNCHYLPPLSTNNSSFISYSCFPDHSVVPSVMPWPWDLLVLPSLSSEQKLFGRVLQHWGPLMRNRQAASTAVQGRKARGAGWKNPSSFAPCFKFSGNSMAGAVRDFCCTSPALAPCCPPLLLSVWITQHHDAIAAGGAQIRRERYEVLPGKDSSVLRYCCPQG